MRRRDGGSGCGACGLCFANMNSGTPRGTVRSNYVGLPSMAGLDWAGRAKRKLRDRDAKSDPPVCRKHGPEVQNRRCEASRGVRSTDLVERAPGGRSARQRADKARTAWMITWRLSALRSLVFGIARGLRSTRDAKWGQRLRRPRAVNFGERSCTPKIEQRNATKRSKHQLHLSPQAGRGESHHSLPRRGKDEDGRVLPCLRHINNLSAFA